jgi:hypothetical protein
VKTEDPRFGIRQARANAVPIAKITPAGLIAIALLVAILWSCILAENSITRSARLMQMQSVHELQMLRNGMHKVNTPPSATPSIFEPRGA